MHLHVAVVMPDHVHLILTPAVDYDRRRVYPLSEILWAIKSASSHRINKLLGCSGAVWQAEYFDTAIRRSESLDQKMEYVRQNPVRAGLVTSAERYEWLWESPRPGAAAGPQISGK
ncbi:MAG: transposase [Acidobacteriia bacterium]|nr:transposase [Terriglobia bacterium]